MIISPSLTGVLVGIQVGLTNCYVAVGYSNNDIFVIPNQYGNTTIPLYISFSKIDNKVIVGEESYGLYLCSHQDYDTINLNGWKSLLTLNNNNNTINNNNNKNNNSSNLASRYRSSDGLFQVEWNSEIQYLNITQILTILVDYMGGLVEEFSGSKPNIDSVCWTVPFRFNDQQRQILKDCLELSDAFKQSTKYIRNESTLACYPHILQANRRIDSSAIEYIVCYGSGETTDSVTIIEIDEDGIFDILLYDETQSIASGKSMTQALVNYFQQHHPFLRGMLNLKPERLYRACKYIKESLSTNLNATRELEGLLVFDTEKQQEVRIDIELSISRAKYDDLIRGIVMDQQMYINRIVNQWVESLGSGAAGKKISYIVLKGGATNTPKVQEMIKQTLPSEAILLGESAPWLIHNPSSIAAYGAVTLLDKISHPVQWISFADFVVLNFGYEASDGSMVPVILRNSFALLRKTVHIPSDFDHLSQFNLDLYIGQRTMSKDNYYLGSIRNIPLDSSKLKGEAIINVIFDLDANGFLKVWVDSIDYHDLVFRIPTTQQEITPSNTSITSTASTTSTATSDNNNNNNNHNDILKPKPVIVDYPQICEIDTNKLAILNYKNDKVIEQHLKLADQFNNREIDARIESKSRLNHLVFQGRRILAAKKASGELDPQGQIAVDSLLNDALFWMLDNPKLLASEYDHHCDLLFKQLQYFNCDSNTPPPFTVEEVD